MLSLKQFLAEAKSRKLTRTATIYLSPSPTALGVVNLFSSQYHLSPDAMRKNVEESEGAERAPESTVVFGQPPHT